MLTRLLTLSIAFLALVGPAAAAEYVPNEVIVRYERGTAHDAKQAAERSAGVRATQGLPGGARQLAIRDGGSVQATVEELRRSPDVAYAVPNHIAKAAQF